MGMSFASVALTIFIWWLVKIEFMIPKATKDKKKDEETKEGNNPQ